VRGSLSGIACRQNHREPFKLRTRPPTVQGKNKELKNDLNTTLFIRDAGSCGKERRFENPPCLGILPRSA
jgi:hypothetical protein